MKVWSKLCGCSTALLGLLALCAVGDATPAAAAGPRLEFSQDKTFKIVQFTDTQDDHDMDPRTIALIEAVLEDQKPNLVVFTGDNVTSGPQTVNDVRTAIDAFASPVDLRSIPWLITFGNHDEDHTSLTGLDKQAQLDIYMSYPNNINVKDPRGVNGVGNMNVLIRGSRTDDPVFNIWALDSNMYSPEKISGQTLGDDGLPGWDYIKASQVQWYTEQSMKLQEKYGKKIPSLMFFHIPLWEFDAMWTNKDRHEVTGEKNETVCPGSFNSGLFAAMLQRGDVKGVFVGHDHVNDYVGKYFGIMLGYSANTGFGTYGLEGDDKDRLRGARVFILHEDKPKHFDTYMVYAKDYGIQ